MEPVQLPGAAKLIELADLRHQPSVSIQLTSSPIPTETGPVQVEYRNLVSEAERRLNELDVPKKNRMSVIERLRQLQDDEEFWRTPGSRALAVFATPDELHAFALHDPVAERVTVSDRFEIGVLLRDGSSRDRAYVLGLTMGHVRLLSLTRGEPPVELPLDLPEDIRSVFAYANNEGDADMPRPAGPEGEKPEERRYCTAVQDAVLAQIGDERHPLVLASSEELEPAYRAVNTYSPLLEESAGFNPSYREPAQLDARAWELLETRKEFDLSQWRELFGTRRSNGLAASGIKDVAVAATAAAVDELLFNVDIVIEGNVDEFGGVRVGEAAVPPVYNVVDEIAARVLRSGGSVRGVHNEDLLDGSPVAAMLRFPVSV
ncbi:MAG: hypothetical protein JWP85_809 [Rhodoglobus sp.]|nr:hypothetical protein [Rhodoglobus sp.]